MVCNWYIRTMAASLSTLCNSQKFSYLPQVHYVLAASFIVCKFDLDKKFSELVGCLAFDK